MKPGEAVGPEQRRRRIFIVAAPGLEGLAAGEMAAQGIRVSAEDGGIACDATLEQLYAANLQLRTASRVLVRVAEFRARTFFELERHARRVEWGAYAGGGRPVRLRVTSRKSRLYHQRAIEERLLEAIDAAGIGATGLKERAAGRKARASAARARRDTETASGGEPPEDGDPPVIGRPLGASGSPGRESGARAGSGGDPDIDGESDGQHEQIFVVRFLHDRCTISADSSGALLHLRGYRQAVARAPLRETLAAALLMASEWDGKATLIDPLCGSGTIPIEAALMARRIAPGLASADRQPRRYAFESWPDFDQELWGKLVNDARAAILPAAPGRILGADRDSGAIAAAESNAARAGVSQDLRFEVRTVSALPELEEGAWLVTNPPYGVRVGESEGLRDLYAALGAAARRALPGGVMTMLSADRRLEGQLKLPLEETLSTRNGGIPVRIVRGEV